MLHLLWLRCWTDISAHCKLPSHLDLLHQGESNSVVTAIITEQQVIEANPNSYLVAPDADSDTHMVEDQLCKIPQSLLATFLSLAHLLRGCFEHC